MLLHPTSLPGGRLGEEAFRFVDWLEAAGQSWWQVLPLGPPDEHGSPYAARSAFAGSPALLAQPHEPVSADEVERFVARHPFWARSWAAYAGAEALADQVRFGREWGRLRAYAGDRGVRLFGDLPIYVAAGSADHVSHPDHFQHGGVAGVPPDDFSAAGQLWGSPLYDWQALRRTGYRWWVERLRRTLELVDLARIDHFRGFVAYWQVDERRRTARTGTWRRGPGREPFDAARAELGELPLVAEDLGVITPAVKRLRDELGLPGMRVLQFGLAAGPRSGHRPGNVPEHCVVYTGTHDNDTARGWFEALPRARREATGLDPREPHWGLVELALRSRARVAIVPAQDVLGLGSEARTNHPGRRSGNWAWRLRRGALTGELAARLREATEAGARVAPGRSG